jgi:N-acylneuraminate cytidylyltransferase/CMP-N,N'-diacetyllegionaminic acid synthase
MSSIKVLWLIAARSGSKSVPHKNIKLLNGKPLLAYRIQTALKSDFSNAVWISTDSEEYAQIAKEFGAKVPFIRPNELAQDSSSSVEVVLHAMQFAEENQYEFDYIGLLEPTSPFISEKQLNDAIHQLDQTLEANAIVAVKESRPHPIFVQDDANYLEKLAKNIASLSNLGRQAFKKQITPSGGFYIAKWKPFLQDKSFYTPKTLSFLVDEMSAIEIDEPIDFLFAEFIAGRMTN